MTDDVLGCGRGHRVVASAVSYLKTSLVRLSLSPALAGPGSTERCRRPCFAHDSVGLGPARAWRPSLRHYVRRSDTRSWLPQDLRRDVTQGEPRSAWNFGVLIHAPPHTRYQKSSQRARLLTE